MPAAAAQYNTSLTKRAVFTAKSAVGAIGRLCYFSSRVSGPTPTAPNFPPVYGHGNWEHYKLPLDGIYAAAAEWKKALEGVEKPWLCWNVSPRWCVLQQRLVQEVGWTPV